MLIRLHTKANKHNQALQSDTQSVAACVQFAALILLHKSRATLGAAELGVMGARLFAFSWVSVGFSDFMPQARFPGIRVFRFITGLVVPLLVAIGN